MRFRGRPLGWTAQRPPRGPSRDVRMVQKSVDRLAILDGVVVAVGWVLGPAPSIIVDGVDVPAQSVVRHRRADLVDLFGRAAAGAGFRIAAPLSAPPTDNARIAVRFADGEVLSRSVATPSDTAAAMFKRFCERVAASPGASLLEIGSRARSGVTYRHYFPDLVRHLGIDIAAGPNVDLVADAHTMSRHFDEVFDFAFSISVFEHLLMPWVAAAELNKVLRDGGMAFVQSHAAWPLHEEPWDFFRFSKDAWSGLFNRLTGFEVVEAGYGEEATIVPATAGGGPLQGIDTQRTFLVSACTVRKIGAASVDWSVDPAAVYDLNYAH